MTGGGVGGGAGDELWDVRDDAVWEYCWKELTVVVIGAEILHAKNSAVNYL